MTLKFNREGVLQIYYPQGLNQDRAVIWIHNHMEWIIKQYHNGQPVKHTFLTGETYLYLGKSYNIVFSESYHPDIVFQQDKMLIYAKSSADALVVMKQWRFDRAEFIFETMVYQCFQTMKQELSEYPKIQIKQYRSRWGCCYPAKKCIILNVSLIHLPIPLIEYIIYHELAHLVHANHAPAFHRLLKRYVPDETIRRSLLRQYRADYQ